MFKKLTTYFISTKIKEQANDLRSERIFVSVILISALADFLGIGLAVSLRSNTLVYLLLANGIICFFLGYLYKNGVNKYLIGHIFIAQHAVSFVFQAWIQGGLVSPGSAAFFLLPAVAMLTMGKRSATAWLLITTGILVGFYTYQAANQAPGIAYDPELREYLFFQWGTWYQCHYFHHTACL